MPENTVVYAVSSGEYSDYGIRAIFSTEEKAQAYCDRQNKFQRWGDHRIEEYVLDQRPEGDDAPIVEGRWVWILDDGTILTDDVRWIEADDDFIQKGWKGHPTERECRKNVLGYFEVSKFMHAIGYFVTEEESRGSEERAIKIATDRNAELKAIAAGITDPPEPLEDMPFWLSIDEEDEPEESHNVRHLTSVEQAVEEVGLARTLDYLELVPLVQPDGSIALQPVD